MRIRNELIAEAILGNCFDRNESIRGQGLHPACPARSGFGENFQTAAGPT